MTSLRKDTLENRLIGDTDYIYREMCKVKLSNFSRDKLIENKLVTKNFCSGLDFFTSYNCRKSTIKFNKIIFKNYQKQVPFQKEEAPGFISYYYNDSSKLIIICRYSKPILRYLDRLSRKLAGLNTALTLYIRPYQDDTKIEIFFMLDINGTLNKVNIARSYKILFFTNEILKVLTTLTRKAFFANNNYEYDS